jgi:hypothetical protein
MAGEIGGRLLNELQMMGLGEVSLHSQSVRGCARQDSETIVMTLPDHIDTVLCLTS